MSTILKCTNRICGKEYSSEFDKCPFCGTAKPFGNDIKETNSDTSMSEKAIEGLVKQEPVKRSGWYSFSIIILCLSVISLVVLTVVGASEGDASYFLIGLGEFLSVSFLCAIVQLLSGIKYDIDRMLAEKEK